MGGLLLYIGIILVASIIVWKGGDMLGGTAESLAQHYNLSPVVHGSIVTAVGSSFPEISTTVLSTLVHGEFDLGVSTIVGSAIFNILVIPGLSAIFSKKIDSEWTFVVKDIQFYIISIVVLLLAFALAVIYYPSERPLFGTMTRGIAAIPVFVYFLYLYLNQQENLVYRKINIGPSEKKSGIGKVWLRFGFSLVLIVVSVEGLVRGAIFLGEYFETPSFIWGVLVLAAATSVPDAIVSIRQAMNKQGIVSLANVVGSNIFDLLVAVPVGVLIAGSSEVNFEMAAPMMLFLSVVTVLLIILLLRNQSLNRNEGWLLLFFYMLFVVWIVLESFEITGWL